MKRILLIYHFFYPDTVISARLFSDLAEYLAGQQFQVTVFTGNRLMRNETVLAEQEKNGNVTILRFSRPGFSQKNCIGRLLNSAVLQVKWLLAFRRKRQDFDVVILGTDPQFSYMMFPFFRLCSRKVRLIHWVFDLYPEAIAAAFPRWRNLILLLTRPFVKFAYRFVDDMVDIGACMRTRLASYGSPAVCSTLTPWALVEPESIPAADPAVRQALFGSAAVGLLYSGTVGHAHDVTPFIELARECRRKGIDAAFCFAGYGNCYAKQVAGITPEDTNIRLAGFASEAELEKRLAAADVHLVSLRPGWEGIVVPSKFFGSLAMGRPVLFSGPETSDAAQWIRQYGVGRMLDADTAEGLRSQAAIWEMGERAFQIYREHFRKRKVLDGWKKLLELPDLHCFQEKM